jgi:hypothetical protein
MAGVETGVVRPSSLYQAIKPPDRRDHVRYMMLIHHDDEALAKAPKQIWAQYAAFNDALAKAGAGFAAGERLESSAAATTVRVGDGGSKVLDGPYADTKEKFAGYFMIDVPDLDQAITWAKRCPSSKYGAVEIRPLTPPGDWPSAWAQGRGQA